MNYPRTAFGFLDEDLAEEQGSREEALEFVHREIQRHGHSLAEENARFAKMPSACCCSGCLPRGI